MKVLKCIRCQAQVETGNKVSKVYCEDCRKVVRLAQGKAHDKRRRPANVLGSQRACEFCGEFFIVAHGSQKVCTSCVPQLNAKRSSLWAKANPEKVLASSRAYNERNRDEINRKFNERRQDPSVRQRRLEIGRKYDALPKQRVDDRMGTAIRRALGDRKNGKSWESIVGYSLSDLMAELESKFRTGMSWDNISEWEIDHIVPKVLFKYESNEDPRFKECWALPNLQPLWTLDNRRKHARLDYQVVA